MCFSVQEANALVEYDNDIFNDFLIAYPTIQELDIEIAYKWKIKTKILK